MSDNPFEPATSSAMAGSDYDSDTIEAVPLDFGQIFNRAWEIMRENLGIVIGLVGIQIVVSVVFAVINQVLSAAQQGTIESMGEDGIPIALAIMAVSFVIQIASAIIGLWLGLGAIRAFVNLAYGRPATVDMLFAEGPKLLPAIVVGLVTGVGVLLGTFLFIVPGIIVGLGLQYANYVLVDQDADIGTALTTSWNMAWPHMWFLFGLGLIIGLGGVLFGLATCGLGFLLLAVYGPVLQAVVYQSLVHNHRLRTELDLV